MTKDREAYKKSYEERQYQRNRKNVRNIKEKVDELKKEIHGIMVYEDDDD